MFEQQIINGHIVLGKPTYGKTKFYTYEYTSKITHKTLTKASGYTPAETMEELKALTKAEGLTEEDLAHCRLIKYVAWE